MQQRVRKGAAGGGGEHVAVVRGADARGEQVGYRLRTWRRAIGVKVRGVWVPEQLQRGGVTGNDLRGGRLGQQELSMMPLSMIQPRLRPVIRVGGASGTCSSGPLKRMRP